LLQYRTADCVCLQVAINKLRVLPSLLILGVMVSCKSSSHVFIKVTGQVGFSHSTNSETKNKYKFIILYDIHADICIRLLLNLSVW
jgi:hypothetical protein